MMGPLRTVDWKDGRLVLIDQTKLPQALEYIELDSAAQVVDAIQSMAVRGAPAIGAAGAYGVALAVRECEGDCARFDILVRHIRGARPTAVNLAWAVDRVAGAARGALTAGSAEKACKLALDEADAICREDIAANAAIATHGAPLIRPGWTVLTHCNTGDLATVSGGTAFGVIRAAYQSGTRFRVFADETRPRLQGLKLTAWELGRAGIPTMVIPDGAAAFLMQLAQINIVIVGADRIAANGDAANKIGTYSVALAARAHDIPFYVAAPLSTIDMTCPSGDNIPIEERDGSELLAAAGLASLPESVSVVNLAFDITPAELVTGIITERGIIGPSFTRNLRVLFRELEAVR